MAPEKNRRETPDRRQITTKDFHPERRKTVRREEDRKNLKAYYATLGLCIITLLALGIASFIYEGGF